MDDDLNLATLLELAEKAPQGEARAAAWGAYNARHTAEVARRDKLRILHTTAARALGERVGRLPGVFVEESEADDFGRAELCLTIDGQRHWTRPIPIGDEKGYGRLRDAIAAYRRADWRRAFSWLSAKAPPRSFVGGGKWDIERVRFDRNQYGHGQWR